MRCIDCDVELTDFEATRRDQRTNQFLDLCNECFRPVADFIPVKERYDLYDATHDSPESYDDGEENDVPNV